MSDNNLETPSDVYRDKFIQPPSSFTKREKDKWFELVQSQVPTYWDKADIPLMTLLVESLTNCQDFKKLLKKAKKEGDISNISRVHRMIVKEMATATMLMTKLRIAKNTKDNRKGAYSSSKTGSITPPWEMD